MRETDKRSRFCTCSLSRHRLLHSPGLCKCSFPFQFSFPLHLTNAQVLFSQRSFWTPSGWTGPLCWAPTYLLGFSFISAQSLPCVCGSPTPSPSKLLLHTYQLILGEPTPHFADRNTGTWEGLGATCDNRQEQMVE